MNIDNTGQAKSGERDGGGQKGRPASTGRTLVEYALLAVVAVAVALLIQAFLVKPYRIPSESMENTLLIGDRVLVDRISWRFTAPQRGEITVFHPPFSGPVLIKRIVGMPGDVISLRDGYVYINGRKLDEPYVRRSRRPAGTDAAVHERPRLVAAAAVSRACRQLLHDGRQPHRQRGQP